MYGFPKGTPLATLKDDKAVVELIRKIVAEELEKYNLDKKEAEPQPPNPEPTPDPDEIQVCLDWVKLMPDNDNKPLHTREIKKKHGLDTKKLQSILKKHDCPYVHRDIHIVTEQQEEDIVKYYDAGYKVIDIPKKTGATKHQTEQVIARFGGGRKDSSNHALRLRKALDMRAGAMSTKEIADHFMVSVSAVQEWLRTAKRLHIWGRLPDQKTNNKEDK